MWSWFRRLSRGRRRLVVAGGIVGVLGVLTLIGLGVIYPRVGEWMVRSRVVPRLEARLGRTVEIGDVDISLGHATLHRVKIRGGADGDRPLVGIARVDVDFDTLSSFVGTAKIEDVVADGVAVALRRGAGSDNFSDLVTRLGLRPRPPGAAMPADPLGSLRPRRLRMRKLEASFADAISGTTVAVGDGEAELTADRHARVRLARIAVTTTAGPGASIGSIAIERAPGGEPTLTVIDGALQLWPRLALSGISGTIAPTGELGRYDVDLAGGYGGVASTLWTATGWIDPSAGTGSIDATADEFTLDKLSPILEGSPVKDFATTRIDAGLHVELAADTTRFRADFHLAGLNVGHPMLADTDVKNVDVAGTISGTFTRATRTLVVEHGRFETRGLPIVITGWWALPGGRAPDGTVRAKHALDATLHIPPIDCQKVLTAIPKEMSSEIGGYKLRGLFQTEIRVAIDWADLQATKLDGDTAIRVRNCKVHKRPDDSPERLLEPFKHYVEVEKDEWISFHVGPDNPDFVPLADVSPYLIKSLMSTEDSGFFMHHGFITSEFESALIKNLEANDFKWGASSITMQMVKNALLYRKKTLARKFQELFLTWDVENVLDKDRIMEIYVNVIEFGPGLYGIGPAARQYFRKAPRDLNPVEAAFFSSILPDPKDRYMQLCEGTLTKKTANKIENILDLMRKRDRLTEEEYQAAKATPLLFEKDSTETVKECLDRAKKVIKNQRSTNPMKQD